MVLLRLPAAVPVGLELLDVPLGATLVPEPAAFALAGAVVVAAGVVPAGAKFVPMSSVPAEVVVVVPGVGVTRTGGFASGSVALSTPLALVVVAVSAVPVPLTVVVVPTAPGVLPAVPTALPPGIPLTAAPAIGITRPSIVNI